MPNAPGRTPPGSSRRSTTGRHRGSSLSLDEAAVIIAATAVAGAMLACAFFAFRKNY